MSSPLPISNVETVVLPNGSPQQIQSSPLSGSLVEERFNPYNKLLFPEAGDELKQRGHTVACRHC
jgi:hypothetical protein